MAKANQDEDPVATGWLDRNDPGAQEPRALRMREAVEAALRRDFFVDEAGIRVSVRGDTVFLDGRVNNADEARRAQDIARDAPEVMVVENRLESRIGETGATGTGAGQPPEAVPEDGQG